MTIFIDLTSRQLVLHVLPCGSRESPPRASFIVHVFIFIFLVITEPSLVYWKFEVSFSRCNEVCGGVVRRYHYRDQTWFFHALTFARSRGRC